MTHQDTSPFVTVRFDLSHALSHEPEVDGTYYIDCRMHPAHVPSPGDRIWLDENDRCTCVRDKQMRAEILRELWHSAEGDSPVFTVDYRIMNYARYITFNICCVLKRS